MVLLPLPAPRRPQSLLCSGEEGKTLLGNSRDAGLVPSRFALLLAGHGCGSLLRSPKAGFTFNDDDVRI